MLARLVNGLEPHPPPLSSQKMKCSFFDYVQLLMISWAGQWTWTSSTTPLQPIKWNAFFCSTSDYWPIHSTPLMKCSFLPCWPDWSMDLNLIHHSSPAKNMKCSFLDYIQLLMISWAVRWTQTPSAIPLQLKKWNAHFLLIFNFWWSAGLVNGLKPHLLTLSSQKNEMLIFVLHSTSDVGQTGQWTQTPSTTPLQLKKWNASFMADDWPGWVMVNGLEPHPSATSLHEMQTKMIKCFKVHFPDYVQLLMISQAGQWTQTPSATLLQPKKWNARFWIMFTSDEQPGWSMDLNPICHPSPANKMKCSFLDYVQLLMISWAGQWTQTPFTTPLQPKKWNAHFLIMFNFWWSAVLVDGLKPQPPLLSSQKNKMLLFGLRSTSDDQLGWSMDSNPILHPSPAKEMKCSNVQLHQLGWSMTQTPSTTHLQPKQWNAIFVLHSTCDVGQAGQWTWTSFNPIHFWVTTSCSELKPHLPKKMKCSISRTFVLDSTTCLQAKKLNAHILIMFNFWCWPDWSMDSNPIHHPSAANKMKCFFLD